MDTRKVTAEVRANMPRRAGRLRMAMVATATVAAAAFVTLVALGGLPKVIGPAGTSSGSPRVSVAPSATLTPTPTATSPQSVTVPWPTVAPSETSVPSSLEGQDFTFWTLDELVPCCTTLRISTSTGNRDEVIDIPGRALPPEAWAEPAGPAGGRVLYVVDDGRTAHLMLHDARTGAGAELMSTSLVIARVAIDPSGSNAYYLLFDRRRPSAFQGLWAVPTDGGQPRPLISVQATTAVATLAAERVYLPQLVVSADGSWIVFVTCQPSGCQFHANHPNGTSQPLDWSNFHPGDAVVGIVGDLLIGSSECGQAICDGFALDLGTGERWPLGGGDHPFAPHQLIAGPRGPLVIGETSDHDQGVWRVEGLDLTDGTRSSVFEATFQPGVTTVRLAKGWYPAGAELPPGWFLIYRNADATGLLPPDYSAATAGAASETELPFMESSQP
jgi:hypothetical protein